MQRPFGNGSNEKEPYPAIEPPPLVGNFSKTDSDVAEKQKLPESSHESPPIPNLVGRLDSQHDQSSNETSTVIPSTPSVLDSENLAFDPNAPPKPIEQSIPKRLEEKPIAANALVAEPSKVRRKGMIYEGELSAIDVPRGSSNGRKPIGFVRHRWERGKQLTQSGREVSGIARSLYGNSEGQC